MEQYEQPQVEIFVFSAREAIATTVWPVNDEQVGIDGWKPGVSGEEVEDW